MANFEHSSIEFVWPFRRNIRGFDDQWSTNVGEAVWKEAQASGNNFADVKISFKRPLGEKYSAAAALSWQRQVADLLSGSCQRATGSQNGPIFATSLAHNCNKPTVINRIELSGSSRLNYFTVSNYCDCSERIHGTTTWILQTCRIIRNFSD